MYDNAIIAKVLEEIPEFDPLNPACLGCGAHRLRYSTGAHRGPAGTPVSIMTQYKGDKQLRTRSDLVWKDTWEVDTHKETLACPYMQTKNKKNTSIQGVILHTRPCCFPTTSLLKSVEVQVLHTPQAPPPRPPRRVITVTNNPTVTPCPNSFKRKKYRQDIDFDICRRASVACLFVAVPEHKWKLQHGAFVCGLGHGRRAFGVACLHYHDVFTRFRACAPVA